MTKWHSAGGGGSLQKILKEAQKAQQELARVQEEIAQIEVEGSSGGGAVKIRINGRFEMLSVKIDPQAVPGDDLELLEDLIRSAYNQAYSEVKRISDQRLSRITAGNIGLW